MMSMVHYLSGFVARDLSGLAVERLFRFISSIQGACPYITASAKWESMTARVM